MEFKRTLVAEDIIVEVIVNMIAVGRSLTFDNYKILNVSAKSTQNHPHVGLAGPLLVLAKTGA